ncbi:NADH-FMN oxidoreductase RutF, flavin reductase (DIM6/NTAB) family [Sulfitobacter brevis]|uniref:NADH-FMN oxidoreductase RutF, flavin reductase (DIM6/NTAB) family n=1 Tax=Sulfitobacter brevis TaxID=74348 RepID=A0A1I2AJB2_9RHOB|nr:flavin reductase family protein [Sulfitobacter brevis]SFE43638.1 NADH-FMN oxidoreductase RutF, flavin reductase (DIM6/NTAB) family [Sulfitobacter brevis]
MFYRPQDGHGLPHNPFNALITPRPIGWISTRDGQGRDNLSPYSFFNGAAYDPPQVMFSSTGSKPDVGDTKDNVANIRETGVFCVNVCSVAHKDAMNASSATLPHGTDEFEYAGLDKVDCELIACSRVANAPASLECKMTQIIRIEGPSNFVVMGEVLGIHMRDDCIVDGKFDATKYIPLSRMGYRDYAAVREVFEMARPDD